MASPRSLLTLTFVFPVIVVRAANSENSGIGRPTVSKCHNTYTYNSNFYAGLNKKVENLLREVKHELKELNRNPNLSKGCNTTIEGLFPEIKNELGEIKKDIKSLKENITADTVNNKIKTLLGGVMNELREMRDEIKSLKENKTIGQLQESNTTVKGLLREIKLELSKLGHGTECSKVYKSCSELCKAGKRTSGVYKINPDNGSAFDVYCDQTTAGGGWTVFQKRLDGSVNFYLDWGDYKRGFGNLNGEFWLGLDKIYRLTKETSKLRVDLEDFSGNTAYAEYSSFGVGDEGSKYKLSLGSYSGTAGDSLSSDHRGMAFSTKDRDNDRYGGNCATQFKGAWWYSACHHSNLNGRYLKGNHSSYADGVNWYHWKGYHYSLKRAEMKIKPVNA